MAHLLVTGAAGFIGSTFLRRVARDSHWHRIVVLDALTYAGHYGNIASLVDDGRIRFVEGDICDVSLVESLFNEHSFSAVVNFAAESHVDNSIMGPRSFLRTNVEGTFVLLEESRKHWGRLTQAQKESFRFIQVSTDEVFGSLGMEGKFSETSPYQPNSPYSSSKAAGDHLVRAWFHTYGLPTIITNCSNNYGPRQFPEKLIPRMVLNALKGERLPVYGEGKNIRDWIHVEDHSEGVWLALTKGRPGNSYCFGGNSERNNLAVVQTICRILDELAPRSEGRHEDRIAFVEDRMGHDFRYAIDDSFAVKELGFRRKYVDFEEGLRETIRWYLDNAAWLKSVTEKTK